MKRWVSDLPTPPAQKWQSRAEILKSHLDSLSPMELLKVRPSYYAARFGYQTLQRGGERKYDPDQPRVPAGNRDGGQWTSTGGSGEQTSVDKILEKAKKLAASRQSTLSKCIDLCYSLLERYQRPGRDFNEFDFRKCLNACMERNR